MPNFVRCHNQCVGVTRVGATPACYQPLDVASAAQLLRALVNEQRHVGKLALRRRGQHSRRQAVLRFVLQAVSYAPQQWQACARCWQDLGLRAPATSVITRDIQEW